MSVFEKIEALQKGIENTPAWMVGEQLKDICRADSHCAELVEKDLDNKSMGLADCEKKIKALADEKHKKQKGSCVCISPAEAEKVIRKFYGLPEAGKQSLSQPAADSSFYTREPEYGEIIDISDFL